MAQNIYVAGAEAKNGKSVIALGLMELLSTRTNRLGFFRPVVAAKDIPDPMIELMATRYALEIPSQTTYGCSYEEARDYITSDRYEELQKVILARYKMLQEQCEHILCLGTDYSGVAGALEFDFNADVANNLGCHVIPVVKGYQRNVEHINNAATAFIHLLEERGCDIMATVINRVDPGQLKEVRQEVSCALDSDSPVYVLGENASLSKPTMRDIAQALDATCLYSDLETLNREVYDYKVCCVLQRTSASLPDVT